MPALGSRKGLYPTKVLENPILKSRLEQGAKLRSYELEITALSLPKAKPLQEGDSLEGERWGGHGWARQKIGGFCGEVAIGGW